MSTPVRHEYAGTHEYPGTPEYPIIQAVGRSLLYHALVGTPSEASKARTRQASKARTRQASKARTGIAGGDAAGAVRNIAVEMRVALCAVAPRWFGRGGRYGPSLSGPGSAADAGDTATGRRAVRPSREIPPQ